MVMVSPSGAAACGHGCHLILGTMATVGPLWGHHGAGDLSPPLSPSPAHQGDEGHLVAVHCHRGPGPGHTEGRLVAGGQTRCHRGDLCEDTDPSLGATHRMGHPQDGDTLGTPRDWDTLRDTLGTSWDGAPMGWGHPEDTIALGHLEDTLGTPWDRDTLGTSWDWDTLGTLWDRDPIGTPHDGDTMGWGHPGDTMGQGPPWDTTGWGHHGMGTS